MTNINPTQLTNCIAFYFKAGLAVPTLTKLRAVVGDVFKLYSGRELHSPLISCLFRSMGRRRPLPPKPILTLSLHQVGEWLHALGANDIMPIKDLRAKVAVLLLSVFSMRFTDMAGVDLTLSHMFGDKIHLAYRGKTAATRFNTAVIVADPDPCLDAVAAVRALIARYEHNPSPALFRAIRGGQLPLSADGISSAVRGVFGAAGVSGRPYDGRAAGVTALRASGISLDDVRLFGRWAPGSTTIERFYDKRTPPADYASRAFAAHLQ